MDCLINTTIELPYGRNLDLAVNAYNMFDLVKLSNVISIDGLVKPEIPVLEEEETYEETGINSDVNSLEDYTTITHTEEEALEQKSISDNRLLLVVLIVLAILALAVMLFFAYLIMELGKNNRRKKRKNRHK